MPEPIVGLHHITAIASSPQRNLDFYTQLLGLRLVKRTVNFDDPGSYHFYFGNAGGKPGTLLTFFAWPHASRGRVGIGETAALAFSIPHGSAEFWISRFQSANVPLEPLGTRFDERVLAFSDPDGMAVELVEHANPSEIEPETATWVGSTVPHRHSIDSLFGATLLISDLEPTARTLRVMGLQRIGDDQDRTRFRAAAHAPGTHIDVLVEPGGQRGRLMAGSIHHIAFRVPDRDSQMEWRATMEKTSFEVTPVLDRTYFQSIYFREPGGVLFEMATDAPGFAIDEPLARLGQALKLPSWLEAQRSRIERDLPPIRLHPGN